ncbi:IclR family transcriptional regulator [Natronolimnohabitans innermongolicus]|uniref:Transcriptional regulator n=1 Tax=Natronolimnohabitans innermongolicus JCM 12255 TaxID=1227499 RepID=L9WRE4_9EURY|nr:IclR family transcriptional regulator [Natronolimnohabitans innermongolicus]ELY50893.1 transcriptional regulator [Natronolimnohabitans innermongolicus JCM 12255]
MVTQNKGIKTAQNSFAIVEAIVEGDQPTCTELSEEVDLSVSSVYNYLKTLKEEGYVVENDGRYRLSLKFLKYGRMIRNSYPLMHAAIKPIDLLAKAIDEYLSLFVRENYSAVMIHEANSRFAVEVPTRFLGEPFHLTRSPQGKVILAHMPDEFRRDVFEAEELGSRRRDELEAELETIANQRHLVDDGQTHENIWAIAAPVRTGDELYGSLMISTIRHRLDDRRARTELPDLLDRTVQEVEHRLAKYDFDDLYSTW